MESEKKVKDIMVGIFEYPHIPFWFSLSQAIKIVRVSFLSTKQYPEPLAVLVFDEKYNLMGTLTLRDILRGLSPGLVPAGEKSQGDESALPLPWENLFDKGAKDLAEKPASEIMLKIQLFVEPDDSVAKAAYLMLANDLLLIPVLENKRKLIGLVRIVEVFDAISDKILKE
jgi:CBS domain-containing protein